MTESTSLHSFRASSASDRAVLRIRPDVRSACLVSPWLTGKFCEHLGNNICHGMEAQILRNPTFADIRLAADRAPNGGRYFHFDSDEIEKMIQRQAKRYGWAAADIDRLVEARRSVLALWWLARGDVVTSPDVGPHGGRAQRVETTASGDGVEQLVYLPLHRVQRYQWRILARSNDLTGLTISLGPADGSAGAAVSEIDALQDAWRSFEGELFIGDDTPPEALRRLTVSAKGAGQFVIARALLYPADHVGGADPDVIRMLRESNLPVLRWPGGNFVSGYHWRDGVGPRDERPTLPNPAWGNAEPNLFGTDEFVAFCRAVGCEPMICVNAGSGTPEEAAAWVEYCNGGPDTPLGARRVANGAPEPHAVRFWEVGNELYGKHQIGWSTPAGYADRYRHFAEAMTRADPKIELQANGLAPLAVRDDDAWNQLLFEQNADRLRCVTDHILVGGSIDPTSDPHDTTPTRATATVSEMSTAEPP